MTNPFHTAVTQNRLWTTTFSSSPYRGDIIESPVSSEVTQLRNLAFALNGSQKDLHLYAKSRSCRFNDLPSHIRKHCADIAAVYESRVQPLNAAYECGMLTAKAVRKATLLNAPKNAPNGSLSLFGLQIHRFCSLIDYLNTPQSPPSIDTNSLIQKTNRPDGGFNLRVVFSIDHPAPSVKRLAARALAEITPKVLAYVALVDTKKMYGDTTSDEELWVIALDANKLGEALKLARRYRDSETCLKPLAKYPRK